MIIFSIPSTLPADFHRIDLPELGRDYWTPTHSIVEADTIATSTTPSAKFRQVIIRDISSVARSYELPLENERAEILAEMMNSGQSSWYIDNGQGVYEINMIAEITPLNPDYYRVTIDLLVIRKVS